MKKFLLPLTFAFVLAGSAAGAPPRSAVPAPYAGTCGIPATQPVWFEFGQPYLQPVFGKPLARRACPDGPARRAETPRGM